MSEDSDSAELAQLTDSPPSPLQPFPPGAALSPLPPDLSSTAPELRDPAPASPVCLHASPERCKSGDSPRFTPPKFSQRLTDTGSLFRQRQNARLAAVAVLKDAPFTKQNRGDAVSPGSGTFQHRGQRLACGQDSADHGNHFTDRLLEPQQSCENQPPP